MRGSPGRLAPLLLALLLLVQAPLALAAPQRHDNYHAIAGSEDGLKRVAGTVLNEAERALRALAADNATLAATALPRQGEEVTRLHQLTGLKGSVSSAENAEAYHEASRGLADETVLLVFHVSQLFATRDPVVVQPRLRESLDALDALQRTIAAYERLGFNTAGIHGAITSLRDHLVTHVVPLLGDESESAVVFFADLAPRVVRLGESLMVFGYALAPGSEEVPHISLLLDGVPVANATPPGSGLFEIRLPIPLVAPYLGDHWVQLEVSLAGRVENQATLPFEAIKAASTLQLVKAPEQMAPGRAGAVTALLRGTHGPIGGVPVRVLIDGSADEPVLVGSDGVHTWRIPPFMQEGEHRVTLVFEGTDVYDRASVSFTLTVSSAAATLGLLQTDLGIIALVSILMGLLGFVAYVVYRRLRKQRQGVVAPGRVVVAEAAPDAAIPREPRRAVVALYHRLLSRARARGVESETRTPREIARQLVGLGASGAAVDHTTRVFEEARYGNEPVPEEAVTPYEETTDQVLREVGA